MSQHALLSAYCSSSAFSPDLRVLGAANGGKTRLVLQVLRERRCRFAFIDCLQHSNAQHALAAIHRQLQQHHSEEANDSEGRGGESEGLDGRGCVGSVKRRRAATAPSFRDGVCDFAQQMAPSLDDAPSLHLASSRHTVFIVLKQAQVSRSSAAAQPSQHHGPTA